MGREQLNWVFAAGFAVVALLGLALGVRLAGGPRKIPLVAAFATQTPLKATMTLIDKAHKDLRDATEAGSDGAWYRMELAARRIASYADTAIHELPPQTDRSKNLDMRKRMKRLIADAEELADLVNDPRAGVRQVPAMVARVSKNCTSCHDVYRSE
jgi:hypothetical protein